MKETSRRQFLKLTAAGVTAAATLPATAATPRRAATIPPHTGKVVPGVHAYADRLGVAAGETIAFHVSNMSACRVSVCKLGHEIDDPRGDQVLHEFDTTPAFPQPI